MAPVGADPEISDLAGGDYGPARTTFVIGVVLTLPGARSPELSSQELLREWRKVMDSVVASTASVGGRAGIPPQLLAPMQRQLELDRRARKSGSHQSHRGRPE